MTQKATFWEWVLFDKKPFYLITRWGFVATLVFLSLLTFFFGYKAYIGASVTYGILTLIALIVLYNVSKKLIFMYKNIILLDQTAMIDNVPENVRTMFGVEDVETAKQEYIKQFKGGLNE